MFCFIVIIYRFTFAKNKTNINRQRRQSDGGALMVWGMVMPSELITLKTMTGKQNTETYISLFKDFAVPIMKLNFQQGYIVAHDNCSIHISRKFKEYANTQSLEFLEWTAMSPDLNIMENAFRLNIFW